VHSECDRKGCAEVKTVTSLQALIGLSLFLDEMKTWCDQNGEYDTEMVSVSLDSVERMGMCVEAIIDNVQKGTPILIANRYDSVYEQLKGRK